VPGRSAHAGLCHWAWEGDAVDLPPGRASARPSWPGLTSPAPPATRPPPLAIQPVPETVPPTNSSQRLPLAIRLCAMQRLLPTGDYEPPPPVSTITSSRIHISKARYHPSSIVRAIPTAVPVWDGQDNFSPVGRLKFHETSKRSHKYRHCQ
jgi:hypothetical protein